MARVIEGGRAILLEAPSGLDRRQEWRPWKAKGYRVPDADSSRVWHEREAIRRIVLEALVHIDADVFLFGSRAGDSAEVRSDYDVGIWGPQPLPVTVIAALRGRLESLPIPNRVDLVDFCEAQAEFSEHVLARGEIELWKRRSKGSAFN